VENGLSPSSGWKIGLKKHGTGCHLNSTDAGFRLTVHLVSIIDGWEDDNTEGLKELNERFAFMGWIIVHVKSLDGTLWILSPKFDDFAEYSWINLVWRLKKEDPEVATCWFDDSEEVSVGTRRRVHRAMCIKAEMFHELESLGVFRFVGIGCMGEFSFSARPANVIFWVLERWESNN